MRWVRFGSGILQLAGVGLVVAGITKAFGVAAGMTVAGVLSLAAGLYLDA